VFGEGSLEQPKGGEKCQTHAVELEFGRVRGDKQKKQSQRGSYIDAEAHSLSSSLSHGEGAARWSVSTGGPKMGVARSVYGLCCALYGAAVLVTSVEKPKLDLVEVYFVVLPTDKKLQSNARPR